MGGFQQKQRPWSDRLLGVPSDVSTGQFDVVQRVSHSPFLEKHGIKIIQRDAQQHASPSSVSVDGKVGASA
jgi:hypothetical protein